MRISTLSVVSFISATALHTAPAWAQSASVGAEANVSDARLYEPRSLFLTLEAGLAAPLGDTDRDAYGFGVNAGLGMFLSLNPYVAVGVRPSYGVLTEDDEADLGGYNFAVLSGVIRVRPLARRDDPARSTSPSPRSMSKPMANATPPCRAQTPPLTTRRTDASSS